MDKSIERANDYKISGITYRLTQGQYPRDKSVERANEYNISGITYRLTQDQYPWDNPDTLYSLALSIGLSLGY
jgi:hypothetical protein